MEKNTELYGEKWLNKLMRLTREQLKELITTDNSTVRHWFIHGDKAKLISIYRSECLVRLFNKLYKIGDTVKYRHRSYGEYLDMTVEREAETIHAGAFVQLRYDGLSQLYDIDPKLLLYNVNF